MNAPVMALAELSPAISDLIYAGLSVAFFVLALAYTRFCEKVR